MKQEKLEKILQESLYVHKEIPEENEENGAYNKWLKKEVKNKLILFKCDNKNIEKVILNGRGKVTIDNETFPYRTLKIETNTDIENVYPRPNTAIKISFDEIDLSNYNRISVLVYPKAIGYHNFYFHFTTGNTGYELLHAPSLIPNQWNHVVWEINNLKRDKVNHLSIAPFLMGCPPEAKEDYVIYIKDITVEEVDKTYEKGWDLEDRIAYSHSGYQTNSLKQAIIQGNFSDNLPYFYLCDENNNIVFKDKIKKEMSNLGTYYILDFTDLKVEGNYYIKINDQKTPLFPISNVPFLSPLWKSINFLRSLRCGENIDGVHSSCHLNCRSVHPDGRTVPNFGGWHDAGDVSQFEICTAEMAHALLDTAEQIKNIDKLLYERLLEEAKVGVEWLLRTRFGDGYRALAVSYSIWRKNVLTIDNQSISISKAENGPFENFLSAACLAVAGRLYQESDSVFANWCERIAIEDFNFAKDGYEKGLYTKRWGPNIDCIVAGIGALAAVELYVLTKDESYLSIIEKYGNIILSCQEKEFPNWQIPIRGFFYEDTNHTKVLSYEHRGHEQTPIQALARMCEVLPNHKDFNKWQESLKLYREYILKTINYTSPYYLLPSTIYQLDKINIDRFTIPSTCSKDDALNVLIKQAKNGIKLNDNVYLRIFPIAYQRRGFHATLLSKTKAVSMIAKVLKDNDLKEIVYKQIEWILGNNPFSSSTMFGEGYNYHPLYVAFSKQIVGALPVGIKTYENDDEPYWPTINNAVYKEIWGHTTGKFIWVLADIYNML